MKKLPAFHDHYPKPLQEWVKKKKWPAFRPIQQRALEAIPIDPKVAIGDYVIAAETATGKTEAVFLPLLARVMKSKRAKDAGFAILYVSPLRALINDQHRRLKEIEKAAGVVCHRWSTDVPAPEKRAAIQSREGVLLTTPESLESMFIGGAGKVDLGALASLEAIVIDELHAFFEGARGRHLQSLLHRLDQRTQRPAPRIGLSATLGQGGAFAGRVLRPKGGTPAALITATAEDTREVKLELKVFLDDEGRAEGDGKPGKGSGAEQIAGAVAQDFSDLKRGLVFCNSRARVETLLARLTSRQEKQGGATYHPHHSSVEDKERTEVEKLMQSDDQAGHVAICTNSLELGMDIGKVERVGQIESTYTVAALRQRIGRSGRRKERPVWGTIYVAERTLEADAHVLDRLRPQTFQAYATVSLALEGQFESPTFEDLHLSTLAHQVVSLARQAASVGNRQVAITAQQAWEHLVLHGPWDEKTISRPFFDRFLETLSEGRKPLLKAGDKPGSWTFGDDHGPAYAVFPSPKEYAVYAGGERVGYLPTTASYRAGDNFVLGGQRWRVVSVNEKQKRINVIRAVNAGAPKYGGTGQAPSGLVVERVRRLYTHPESFPAEANVEAEQCIREGRQMFSKLGLERNRLLQVGRDVLIFPWSGARRVQTVLLALRRDGLKVAAGGFVLVAEDTEVQHVRVALESVRREGLVELDELAREARLLRFDLYDHKMIPYHRRLAYARRFMQGDGVTGLLDELIGAEAGTA